MTIELLDCDIPVFVVYRLFYKSIHSIAIKILYESFVSKTDGKGIVELPEWKIKVLSEVPKKIPCL